jgi:hypothetical protein
MFDARETEAERLDRLEREARRRKWDSAIMVRSRDSALAGLTPAAGMKLPAERPATLGDDRPLLDLMAERLDLLERKASRLEAEVRVWEQKDRRRKRLILGAGLVAAACSVSGVALATGLLRTERAAAGRPDPSGADVAKARLDAANRELP